RKSADSLSLRTRRERVYDSDSRRILCCTSRTAQGLGISCPGATLTTKNRSLGEFCATAPMDGSPVKDQSVASPLAAKELKFPFATRLKSLTFSMRTLSRKILWPTFS